MAPFGSAFVSAFHPDGEDAVVLAVGERVGDFVPSFRVDLVFPFLQGAFQVFIEEVFGTKQGVSCVVQEHPCAFGILIDHDFLEDLAAEAGVGF